MSSIKFLPVKTRALRPPKDDLYSVLDKYLPRLLEGDILVITSKVVALHQGRAVKITPGLDKDKLIMKEAEKFISRRRVPGHYAIITLKGYTLIPSAGIDASNADGHLIFWPKKPVAAAREIWQYLRKKNRIKNLGVIITDSHATPLRRGVGGVSIGFFGFHPVNDLRGTRDIFGRKLKITTVNIADGLAAAAVLLMGEAAERTPLLLVRGVKFVRFTNRDTYRELVIPPKEDLYAPLLKVFRKKSR